MSTCITESIAHSDASSISKNELEAEDCFVEDCLKFRMFNFFKFVKFFQVYTLQLNPQYRAPREKNGGNND